MGNELIECWRHGVKVLSSTKCDYWEGKTCGEVPACFYKTRNAKWQYFEAKKNPAEPEEEIQDEDEEVQGVDDAFW